MGILRRTIFKEVASASTLGVGLFTFVLFLQTLGKNNGFLSLLVRAAAPASTVGYLLSLVIPLVVPFTVPLGILVGILIGLSRMSSDGEITAMRAAGVPAHRIVGPVMLFAFLGTVATACAALWLKPLSMRETYRVVNRLAATQLTAEIQPRVFDEQFPNTILYVGDVVTGPVVRWRNLFLADLTAPSDRKTGNKDAGEGPRITIAEEAIAIPDVAHNRIQLNMVKPCTHELGKDPINDYYIDCATKGEQGLEAQKPGEQHGRPFEEMDTGPLYKAAYKDPTRDKKNLLEARIELHQRLALPMACILLALVGIPLGASSRKAGKSAAVVMTVCLAFLYWMGLISMVNFAKQGTLPVGPAIWTPNIVFAIAGLILILRLETPGDRDLIGSVRNFFVGGWQWLRGHVPSAGMGGVVLKRRLPLLPQLIDTYILTSFLFYFILMLSTFVLMTEVYNFFELLNDIVKNNIPWSKVMTYLVFLAPQLIFDSTPMSVLVAVLVTFGVLTKNNEVTAMKACGVSVHRMSISVLLVSIALSGSLFAFDYYYVPEANRIQDALRNEIKGKPVQTYLRPDRKYIFGHGSRIYYYQYLDPSEQVMSGVSVYDLDPKSFQLKRVINAQRARWEPALHTWIFQNGWKREFNGIRVLNPQNFIGQTATFPELDERPDYFLQRFLLYTQMNFNELDVKIRELKQSGFDTIKLQVQFHKKFSIPLFALIMAMMSIPFAFLTGNRGAMAGVGVSFGIAIAYWSIRLLFEQIGNANQLPPDVAAWSPDAVFSLAGMYLLARMRT